jgi:hypothetical protein
MINILRKWVHAFRRRMANLETGMAALDELDRSYSARGFWRR